MPESKQKIQEELKKLEELINNNSEKEKIEKQRKKLDELLEEYTKDL